jgi:hypothetical protein
VDKASDTKSNLIQKIEKDIKCISVDVLDEKAMLFSMGKLESRCSTQKTFGCSIRGIVPFSTEEESEFFRLYYTIRFSLIHSVGSENFSVLINYFNQIRTILIYQHMPLVDLWVGQHRGGRSRHMMCDSERKSEGNKILIDCVDKFDPSKGVKFSGYIYQSMNNMLLKDARDTRKHNVLIEDPDGSVSTCSVHALLVPDSDDPAISEARLIWDDIYAGKNSAKFLTDVERSIIATEIEESNSDKDQDDKAKLLNMNMETYRKRKRNALQKIKETIISRICGHT